MHLLLDNIFNISALISGFIFICFSFDWFIYLFIYLFIYVFIWFVLGYSISSKQFRRLFGFKPARSYSCSVRWLEHRWVQTGWYEFLPFEATNKSRSYSNSQYFSSLNLFFYWCQLGILRYFYCLLSMYFFVSCFVQKFRNMFVRNICGSLSIL